MKLDAQLHRFVDSIFTPAERAMIKAKLATVDYHHKSSMVCAKVIIGTGTVDSRVLVITHDAIGFGWPMVRTVWKRQTN